MAICCVAEPPISRTSTCKSFTAGKSANRPAGYALQPEQVLHRGIVARGSRHNAGFRLALARGLFKLLNAARPVSPGNAFVVIPNTKINIVHLAIQATALPPDFGKNGACLLAAVPQKACHEQIAFWAPEMLLTVLSVGALSSQTSSSTDRSGSNPTVAYGNAAEHGRLACRAPVRRHHTSRLDEAAACCWRLASDRTANGRLVWAPRPGGPIARTYAERPFSASGACPTFRRSGAGGLRWCCMHWTDAMRAKATARSPRAFLARSVSRSTPGRRMICAIATIRLVQRGLALMRGGNRELLRPKPKNK